jgi:hypothetical protein
MMSNVLKSLMRQFPEVNEVEEAIGRATILGRGGEVAWSNSLAAPAEEWRSARWRQRPGRAAAARCTKEDDGGLGPNGSAKAVRDKVVGCVGMGARWAIGTKFS